MMLEELGDNSPSANPYAHFRCCCATFHTKPHAQLAGVLSFSLFICMVVISLYTFGSFSIFYIAIGVIVYSFLMRAVFNAHAEKIGVLAYLVFESIQIGFLTALIMYCMMPVFVDHTNECAEYKKLDNSYNKCIYRNNADSRASVIQLLICLSLLTGMKFYFTRVFARYYKYLMWAEQKGNSIHAQYWNSRGVRINVDDVFASGPNGQPPHVVWSNNGNGYLLNLGTLPTLPSYSQIVGPNDGHRKPSADLTFPLVATIPSPATPAATVAPPTWDGEMSTTAPPTYTLPTVTTQHTSTITGVHTATVFDQQIPIAAHLAVKPNATDLTAATATGTVTAPAISTATAPTDTTTATPTSSVTSTDTATVSEQREVLLPHVTEQHILPSKLHNPASNLQEIEFDELPSSHHSPAESAQQQLQHSQHGTAENSCTSQ